MNYKEELDKLQKTLETKKMEKVRLEERIKQLEEEQIKILTELKEIGLSSIEEANKVVVSLENEIQEGLKKCSDIIK